MRPQARCWRKDQPERPFPYVPGAPNVTPPRVSVVVLTADQWSDLLGDNPWARHPDSNYPPE
jgi:hypothetical protein